MFCFKHKHFSYFFLLLVVVTIITRSQSVTPGYTGHGRPCF